jgi:hypothetical protein
MTYDPNDNNSLFARILERFDRQDEILERIKIQAEKTNGRVTSLEKSDSFRQAFTAGAIAVVTALSAIIGIGVEALIHWIDKTK